MGNVLLRPWQDFDAAALLAARDTTPDLDRQFASDFLSEQEAASYISEYLGFDTRVRNWAIVVGGAPVGNVGLSNICKSNRSAWAFYWLAANARGKGYASNALATVADWAYQNQIFRLELGHRTNNPESCRVATNAGFIVEGLERQKLKYGDERFDVELHSRLATDPAPTGRTIYPVKLDNPAHSPGNLTFSVPTIDDLSYRQHLMADPATMSYNAPWTADGTGCIPQTDEQLRDWYQNHYLKTGMYYAYILIGSVPVGEVSIGPDGMVSLIIEAKYRNSGYGKAALSKLCKLAFTKLGYEFLIDDFPVERVGAERLFTSLGFEWVNSDTVKLAKQKWLVNSKS